MTPKEKAEELVELMKWEGEDEEEQCYQDFAKQCALIAVDEIIQAIIETESILNSDGSTSEYEYWQQVKNEIERL